METIPEHWFSRDDVEDDDDDNDDDICNNDDYIVIAETYDSQVGVMEISCSLAMGK